MENIVVIIILAAIVGGIVWYLIRSKRNGAKCSGCNYAKGCGGQCNSCSSKNNGESDKK